MAEKEHDRHPLRQRGAMRDESPLAGGDGRARDAVVRHTGMVEHRHTHTHEHVILNDAPGGIEADARRGGDGRQGLREAQDAFARTMNDGPLPTE